MTDLSAINLFFSDNVNDTRGEYYYKAFIAGGSRAVDLNDTTKKTDPAAWGLALCNEYPDREGMKMDQDIHYEFVDFIVSTALHHRKLDVMTTTGVSGQILTSVVNDATKALARITALTDAIKDTIVPPLPMGASVPTHDLVPAFSAAGVTTTLDNHVDAICTDMVADTRVEAEQRKLFAVGGDWNVQSKASVKFFAAAALVGEYKKFFAQYMPGHPAASIHDALDASHAQMSTSYASLLIKQIMKHVKQLKKSIAPTNISLDTAASKKLYDGVYKKWNSLPDEVRKFYEGQLSIVDLATRTNRVSESAYESLSPLNNYGFNMHTTFTGSTIYPFSQFIPQIHASIIKRAWYTFENGVHTPVGGYGNPKFAGMLQDTYDLTYGMGLPCISVSGGNTPFNTMHTSTMRTMFSVNMDSVIRKALATAKDEDISQVSPSLLFELDTQNILTLKDGKYYLKVGDKEIPYGDPSDPLGPASGKNECYGSKIPYDKCAEFIGKCIISEDTKKLGECFEFMDKTIMNIDEKLIQDIKQMHPRIARAILRKFKFDTVTEFDPVANMQIRKIQSVGDWLLSLDDATAVNNIKNNPKLRHYLDLVVRYVNANPVILNDSFDGQTVGSTTGHVNGYLDKVGIKQRRDLPRSQLNKAHIMILPKYAEQMYIGTPLRHPYLPIATVGSMPFTPMIGGANPKCSYASSVLLSELINGTIRSLERNGSTLAKADRIKIELYLQNFQQIEKQLLKIFRYLQLYKKYHGEFDENTTYEKLAEAVRGYNTTLTKRNTLEATTLNLINKLSALL